MVFDKWLVAWLVNWLVIYSVSQSVRTQKPNSICLQNSGDLIQLENEKICSAAIVQIIKEVVKK